MDAAKIGRTVYCPRCGTKNAPGHPACRKCFYDLVHLFAPGLPLRHCVHCRAELAPAAIFCRFCGRRLEAVAVAKRAHPVWRWMKHGVIFALIVVFAPLGAVLMWLFTRWSLWLKLPATLWTVWFLLAMLRTL